MQGFFTVGKRSLALLLILTLIFTVLPMQVAAASEPVDIDGHWAASAIQTCRTYGIMNGDGYGYYKPNEDITRAEFAALVNRAFGYDTIKAPALSGYKDVSSNKWYASDMKIAIGLDYLTGYGNGIAAPEDKITREQAAVILARVLRLKSATGGAATSFTDIDGVSSWALDAVLMMEASGLMVGSGNQFMPKKNITRGETAQLLCNIFGTIIDSDTDANGTEYNNVTIRKSGI